VTYTFSVKNLLRGAFTLNSMVDSVYGDLTLYPDTTCSVPQELAPKGQEGDGYDCTIEAYVGGPPGLFVNSVTVAGTDERGRPVGGSATAEVVINDVPSVLEVSKTVEPVVLVEPGGEVVYTIQVRNSSDTPGQVKFDGLIDDVYGDLMDPNNPLIRDSTCEPVVLQPGEGCECTFKADVVGSAGFGVIDTVTAYGRVVSSDSATVVIIPPPPHTGVSLPPPVISGGLAAAGGMLLAVGVWMRRRIG
jgi:hypothetical protein